MRPNLNLLWIVWSAFAAIALHTYADEPNRSPAVLPGPTDSPCLAAATDSDLEVYSITTTAPSGFALGSQSGGLEVDELGCATE